MSCNRYQSDRGDFQGWDVTKSWTFHCILVQLWGLKPPIGGNSHHGAWFWLFQVGFKMQSYHSFIALYLWVLRRFWSSRKDKNVLLATQVQCHKKHNASSSTEGLKKKSICETEVLCLSLPADVAASLCWSVHRPAPRLDSWPQQSGGSGGCRESNFKSEGCVFYSIFPHLCCDLKCVESLTGPLVE